MTEPVAQSPPPTPSPPPPTPSERSTARRSHQLPRSRAGGLWVLVVVFALVLLLLLIFILQNGQRSDVYFLGAHGHLPMAVALLFSAIFGVLLVALPTVVRIAQLRVIATRHRNRTADRAPARGTAPKVMDAR